MADAGSIAQPVGLQSNGLSLCNGYPRDRKREQERVRETVGRMFVSENYRREVVIKHDGREKRIRERERDGKEKRKDSEKKITKIRK